MSDQRLFLCLFWENRRFEKKIGKKVVPLLTLAGPRPERTEHVEFYQKEIPEFSFRSKVKGGLTGYAQIYGRYNTTAYDKLRLDLMYIENYSFFLDLKLIIMTVQIMLKRESTEGFDKVEELEKKRQELIMLRAMALLLKNHLLQRKAKCL